MQLRNIITLIFFATSLMAQDISYEMSDRKMSLVTASMVDVIVDKNSKELYAIKKKDGFAKASSQIIQVLSPELAVLNEKINKDGSTRRFIKFVDFGGEPYLLTAEIDRKRKNVTLSFKVFDPSKADIGSDGERFMVYRVPKSSHLSSAYPLMAKGLQEANLLYSLDSSKVAVVIPIEGEKVEIRSFVFDENLNLLWKDNKRIRVDRKDFKTEDFFLTNNGELYISYQIEENANKFTKNRYDKLNIVKVDSTGNDLEIAVDLSRADFFVTNFSFLELNGGKVRLVGYMYMIRKNALFPYSGPFKGLFVGDFDSQMTEPDWVINDVSFKDYLIEENGQKKDNVREKRGEAAEERNMRLIEAISFENDESVIVGEQFYVQREGTATPGRTTRVYVHGNILAFKLNAEGKLMWAKKIPRRQEGSSTLPQGTVLKKYNNNLILIFNDHEKNLDPERRLLYTFRNNLRSSKLVAVRLNLGDGTIQKEAIFDLRDNKILPLTSRYYELSKNQILMFGTRSYDENLIKLIFSN